MRLLRPSAKTLTTVAKPLGDAFARGRRQPQGGDRAEHAPGGLLAGPAEVRRRPDRHGRPGRLHADAAVRQPGARRAGARAGLLQLPDADLPQRGEPAVGEHRRRHARARRPGARRRAGPTTRASRRRRPPTGRRSKKRSSARARSSTTTTCTPTPIRTSAGPGQPRVCEAANETYEKGKAVLGNLPAASVANQREITSREENLFGQKYSGRTAQEPRHLHGQAEAGEEEDGAPRGRRNEPLRPALAPPRRHPGPRAQPHQPGPLRDRLPGDRDRRRVLRLHQAHPVQTRLPPERAVRQRDQHQTEVAGAHRRRQRRQGDRHQAPGLDRAGEAWKSNRAGCRCTPTRR